MWLAYNEQVPRIDRPENRNHPCNPLHFTEEDIMKIRPVLALILSTMALGACSTGPSKTEIANADYGSPPIQYEEIIKAYYAERLIDPTSPLYTFDEPRKSWIKSSAMYGTEQTFGWRVCGTVNAKNRMGGYTGRKPFFALFRDGQLVFINDGSLVADACNKRVD